MQNAKLGSEGSAAGGRYSDLSEWQRSVCNAAVRGKAHTGHRNRKRPYRLAAIRTVEDAGPYKGTDCHGGKAASQ